MRRNLVKFGGSILGVMVFLLGVPVFAATFDEMLEKNPEYKQAFESFPADIQEGIRKNEALGEQLKKEQENRFPGTTACFDHYRFGSVKVPIEPSTNKTVAGAELFFTGKVENENPYPVVGGSVYVKVFLAKAKDEIGFTNNAYPVVDQFVAVDNMSVPANGEKPIQFSWKVPQYAEKGEYMIATYFFTDYRYNLLGLNFTDDVTGNQARFSVDNAESLPGRVIFDKYSVTLNGNPHHFAQLPVSFGENENVEIAAKIVNPRDESVTVPVKFTLTPWDGLRKDSVIDTRTEMITLAPKETKTVSYTVRPHPNTVSFVTAELKDFDTKSILNIRFARAGANETRIEFPTILKYPLKTGEENSLFSCVHSTFGNTIDKNLFILTLRDESGNIVASHRYMGSIPSSMTGVEGKFTPKADMVNFSVTATLEREGRVFEEITQHYRCSDIDPNLCPKPVIQDEMKEKTNWFVWVGGALVVLISLLGVFFIWRHRRKNQFGVWIVGLFVLGTLFVSSGHAEAKTVDVNFPIYTSTITGLNCTGTENQTITQYFGAAHYTVTAINESTGQVLNDGAVVNVGQVLRFDVSLGNDYNTTTTTVNFISPLACGGSPLGVFAPNANYVGAALSVNPPVYSVSRNAADTADMSCVGMRCTVTRAGVLRPIITFSPTFGKFYVTTTGWYPTVGLDINGNPLQVFLTAGTLLSGPFAVPSPLRFSFINFSFTAVDPNAVPAKPTFTVDSASKPVNTDFVFTARTTDPDNDTIRYAIDWNNDNVRDVWLPNTGSYVASGTALSVPRQWVVSGTATVKVYAEDSRGGVSPWSDPLTVTITPAVTGVCGAANGQSFFVGTPPSGGALCSSGAPSPVSGSGPWTWNCLGAGGEATSPQCGASVRAPLAIVDVKVNGVDALSNIAYGSNLAITWTVSNATSCTATGNGWNGAKSATGSALPDNAVADASSIYTLTCYNADNVPTTDTVSVSLANVLKLCENTCTSDILRGKEGMPAQTLFMPKNSSADLVACDDYRPTCSNSGPVGDVTSGSTWNDTPGPAVTLSSVAGKQRLTAGNTFPASETLNVQSGGRNVSLNVNVICIPKTCSAADVVAVTDTYCPSETRNTGISDNCTTTLSCPGTRYCDFNYKEVSP